MHQIFYIDIEEEISSVVDKLRKSLSGQNYFVVTERSLMSQSAVNFKLLKREAEKIQKSVIIISQDEKVLKMAARAGINVRDSIEGLEVMPKDEPEVYDETEKVDESAVQDVKRKRLKSVGSDDFYAELMNSAKEDISTVVSEEISIVKEKAKTKVSKPTGSTKTLSDLKSFPGRQGSVAGYVASSKEQPSMPALDQRTGRRYDINKSFEEFLDPEKEKKLEKVFSQQPDSSRYVSKNSENEKRPSMGNKFFWALLFFILISAGAAGYYYIPSAKVKVYLEKQDKQFSMNLNADKSVTTADVKSAIIPLRILEKEEELTASYDSTGVSESSGQKARGTLVIYNEYGNSPQSLVATTRFETEDGKIFRLVKGAVVPGMTVVGGEKKPGAIEAEVVADKAGDDYNVGPAVFKIPGFKDGDKYEKIYAKSGDSMTGGGVSGDEIKIVSQADIDSAKTASENALKEKMENSVRSEIRNDEIILPIGSVFEFSESLSLAAVDDVKNLFDYKVKGKGKFLIVSEDIVKQIAEEEYKNKNKVGYEISISDLAVSYENAQVDFDSGKATIGISSKVSAMPVFNSEEFKKKILSKKGEEIGMIAKNQYPYIKDMEVGLYPEFMRILPRFSQRVMIEEVVYSESQ